MYCVLESKDARRWHRDIRKSRRVGDGVGEGGREKRVRQSETRGLCPRKAQIVI